MDNFKEITEVFRKVSLASIGKPDDITISKQNAKEPPPKDRLFLVHILFFMIGLLHILPLTFFITANDYWMYKFRDPSLEEADSSNRTVLQTYFSSGIIVGQSVPMVICMLLSTAFAHKAKLRPRVITTLTIVASLFTLFTAMIGVDTDSWQVGFFVLSIAGLCVDTGVLTLFQVSTLGIVTKFPPQYMKTFLFGEGVSGIFNTALQIISLAIGTSSKVSAVIYFVSGTLVIFITLALYIISKHFAFFRYYANTGVEQSKLHFTKAEVKEVVLMIWPTLAVYAIVLANIYLTQPSVTALVVSENYGNGDPWNDKFFVPTITFFFSEVCSVIGRLSATDIIRPSNGHWWVVAAVVRFCICVPLILFCNALPRNHLPVLFPHDWEYILVMALISYTNGYVFNAVFLSIPRLAPGKEELAFLLMICVVGTSAGLLSPLSLLAVHFL